jgi:hypothetical protein
MTSIKLAYWQDSRGGRVKAFEPPCTETEIREWIYENEMGGPALNDGMSFAEFWSEFEFDCDVVILDTDGPAATVVARP